MIKLTRPICFFDIEATGIDRENDRIIEICVAKLHPDKEMEVKHMFLNPGIPIPAEATEIHGITDERVKDEPTFKQVAKSLLEYITGCDLAGFNSNSYDIPMLFFEFERAGVTMPYQDFKMVDVGNIFKIQEPRTLEAAVKFYCEKTHEGAHGAVADTLATVDVFLKQLERYPDMPQTVEELHKFSNFDREIVDISGKFTKNKDGEICFTFGKHRGEPAKNHPDFLNWMLTKATFNSDTRAVASDIYGQIFNLRM